MTIHQEFERAKMLVEEIGKRRRRFANKRGNPIPVQDEARWLYSVVQIAEKLAANLHAMASGEAPTNPAPEADPVPAPKDVVDKKDTPEAATVPPPGSEPWSQ